MTMEIEKCYLSDVECKDCEYIELCNVQLFIKCIRQLVIGNKIKEQG